MPKLGVNIDHVATLRQARQGRVPEVWRAAKEAEAGGADGITIHLREDRRHIQDWDLGQIRRNCRLPINLEMALDSEIIQIALHFKPEKVCLVPERRRELTTEGGLDILKKQKELGRLIPRLQSKKIEVSLFVNPYPEQIRIAAKLEADAVELHTGRYAEAKGQNQKRELERLKKAVVLARHLGLQVNAGHGLNYQNVFPVARIPGMKELNIGHAIVSRAVFTGMRRAVKEMKRRMQ